MTIALQTYTDRGTILDSALIEGMEQFTARAIARRMVEVINLLAPIMPDNSAIFVDEDRIALHFTVSTPRGVDTLIVAPDILAGEVILGDKRFISMASEQPGNLRLANVVLDLLDKVDTGKLR